MNNRTFFTPTTPLPLRAQPHQLAVGILGILHIVGTAGLNIEALRSYFLMLTPLNLLLTTGILLWFHGKFTRPFWFFALFTFFSGLGVEILGIQTGVIFGEYAYGWVLGPKIGGAPWLIGVNWLMLIYATGSIANKLAVLWQVKATVGAALMTLIDVFIEPVAICLGFWEWSTPAVPLQNYVAWFGISWVMLAVYYLSPFAKNNPIAAWVYFIQLLFFIANNVVGFC